MSRGTPSAADRQLVAYAEAHAVKVTASQLERWRAHGLLPPNTQRALGRGRGSTSAPADGAGDLVVLLGRHARAGRRPHDLALLAYDAGLVVPERAVRAALAASIHRVVLKAEREVQAVEGGDRGDWTWEVVARELDAHPRGVLVPRRMRRIDDQLAAWLPWSHESIAQYDKGPAQPEPMNARDLDALSVAAVLGGGTELTGPAMAAMMRAMGPAGAAMPAASMLEYENNPDLTLIGDAAGFTMMPAGDMRKDLLLVVEQATSEQLRLAWQTAAAQRVWALQLVENVEAELAAGQPGPGCLEWFLGSVVGLHRMIVRTELRARRDTLASRASTAVGLLHTARALRVLREAIPNGQYQLLQVIVPQFMHELIDVETPPGFTLMDHLMGEGNQEPE